MTVNGGSGRAAFKSGNAGGVGLPEEYETPKLLHADEVVHVTSPIFNSIIASKKYDSEGKEAAVLLGRELVSFNATDLWNHVVGLRREVDRLANLLKKFNLGGPEVREMRCLVCGFQLKAQEGEAQSNVEGGGLLVELVWNTGGLDVVVCGGPSSIEGGEGLISGEVGLLVCINIVHTQFANRLETLKSAVPKAVAELSPEPSLLAKELTHVVLSFVDVPSSEATLELSTPAIPLFVIEPSPESLPVKVVLSSPPIKAIFMPDQEVLANSHVSSSIVDQFLMEPMLKLFAALL